MAERMRRALGLRPRAGSAHEEPPAARIPAPAAALRNLGEPPGGGPASAAAGSRDQAGEAELDALRGELVRELDRLAEGDHGSASFRRIAS
jgi:hypothetical protein